MHALHIPLMRVTTTRLHIVDYKEVTAASDKLLRDRSAGFVLLHLPVPHPWGIWDRKTNDFTTNGSSYVNNLALADKCLAGLRATLEETGQWDSSTVVVMGDHGWRTTQLWRSPQIDYAWSKEDEQASQGGEFDGRPAYLVKLPGQTVGSRVDTPFHSVNTRQLIDGILSHKINSTAELTAWAESVK
jgi:arylsulfatase A-like enzyme